MDLKTFILSANSKANVKKIQEWVGEDAERFSEVMTVFFEGDKRAKQLAAFSVGTIGEQNPDLIRPYMRRMIEHLDEDVHDAVIRNTLRIFETKELCEELDGLIYDKCFYYLTTPKYPVAVRAYAMTILTNISLKYPDLIPELMETITALTKVAEEPGFLSRSSKMLRRLNKEGH